MTFEEWQEDKQEDYDESPRLCEICGEPIYDEKLINVDGEYYHKHCFNEEYEQINDRW